MGSPDQLGLLNRLYRHKFTILSAAVIVLLAALAYHYYVQSTDRGVELTQKNAELEDVSAQYSNLSQEHVSLVARHNNLTDRYDNLSESYRALSSNESSLRAAYEGLNVTVTRLQEKSGPVVAIWFRKYKGGTVDEPKIIVDVTAYNLGNRAADRVTVKCRVIFDNQPSVDERTITGIAPLDKKSCTFEFSIYTDVEAVWAVVY